MIDTVAVYGVKNVKEYLKGVSCGRYKLAYFWLIIIGSSKTDVYVILLLILQIIQFKLRESILERCYEKNFTRKKMSVDRRCGYEGL